MLLYKGLAKLSKDYYTCPNADAFKVAENFTQTTQENCLPHYPKTTTGEKVCIPPPPPDLDCKDIGVGVIVVDIGDGDPDPHNLDSDGDGVGCE